MSWQPEDRTAFLNALQTLTSKMNQPKRAFKILLEDFLKDPSDIQFSDAKALMLANLILHEYDKNLADIEITPEDILFNQRGLDKEVARYAAWRMDRDQEAFFRQGANHSSIPLRGPGVWRDTQTPV
jgi:hypothetical protein